MRRWPRLPMAGWNATFPASPAPMGVRMWSKRGAAHRQPDWPHCLRLRWRSGASLIGVAMPSTVRSGELWTCPERGRRLKSWRFSCRCNPGQSIVRCGELAACKAMALLRRLFIEAVTIPACLSSRKSRAGPFNPPSEKISPAVKSAPLTLRPFG